MTVTELQTAAARLWSDDRCRACFGSGRATCVYCSGTGKLRFNERCPGCNGSGRLFDRCTECDGAGARHDARRPHAPTGLRASDRERLFWGADRRG